MPPNRIGGGARVGAAGGHARWPALARHAENALAAAEAPFGGTKYSGIGREGGTEGIAAYLDIKLAQMTL